MNKPITVIDGEKLDGKSAGTKPVTLVACVTAYNEAATIGSVIDALRRSAYVTHIHVVDDGSTDDTATIARAHGADVLTLPERVPVGEAIRHHCDGAPDDLLLWCDADLVGLTTAHIDTLVEAFLNGQASQILSSRALPPSWPQLLDQPFVRWSWQRIFGPISGERIMWRRDFTAALSLARRLGWSEMVRGYGIVLFLNWYFREFGLGHKIVYLAGLRQRQKYQKWGKSASGEMISQWLQFIRVWIKIRCYASQIKSLRATAAKSSPYGSTREKSEKVIR
ncbi:MAG: glycosyltransferase [Pseudomonadota bacterium]